MKSSKTTRRALLGSLTSLVLCFAMLIGSTFAWFTDSASTSVNTIQAGNLDVALEMKQGDDWVNAEGQTLNFVKASSAPAGEDILWEPGCTYDLPELRIRNDGNLAFKYKVVITGIQGSAELNEAIEWTITNDGTAIANSTGEYALTEKDAFNTLTISGHMKEEAGNGYQGLSIEGISITVYATQYTFESDSNNNQYDAGAEYDVLDTWTGTTEGGTQTEPSQDQQPTQNTQDGNYHITSAAEFINYIKGTTAPSPSTTNRWDDKTVVLDKSIDLNGYEFVLAGETYQYSGTFDGKGHTVSNFKITRTDGNFFTGLFGYLSTGASIKNLTVKNAVVTSNGEQVSAIAPGLNGGAVVENCRVVDSTVKGARQVGGVVGYTSGSTVKNCKAENCTIICTTGEYYPELPTMKQVGAVVGFVNAGSTVTGNTESNCNIITSDASYVASGVVLNTAGEYEISSAAGLNWFNDQINNQHNSFGGSTVKLTADIDYKGGNWLPAGQNDAKMYDGIDASYNTVQFLGTFDGNGKTISNINIKGLTDDQVGALSAAQQQVYSVGFIGYKVGVTVKNLTIKNVTVSGSHYVGAIVGMTDTGATIENCTVENATITCKHVNAEQCGDKAGGIVGNLAGDYSKVSNCTVKESTIKAGRDAGQVVGCAQSESSGQTGCTATNVTVSAIAAGSEGACSHTNAGRNMEGIVGRDLHTR